MCQTTCSHIPCNASLLLTFCFCYIFHALYSGIYFAVTIQDNLIKRNEYECAVDVGKKRDMPLFKGPI